jgi:peptidyl-dipeptidase Dcp
MTRTPDTNPLLASWDAPHGMPPFADLHPGHFAPALERAMQEQRAELDAIAASTEPPSFDNTVAAFDRSGRLLARVGGVFHNLCSSEASPALQAVQSAMAQPLAAHENAVYMNAGLFARIEVLHERRAELPLDGEQLRLLERLHLDFVRSGARLAPAAQARYAQVMERLAELTTRFALNVLADEAAFRLELKGEADLAGLPDFVRGATRQAAVERGLDGHVVTLSRSLVVPFLTFSERRDLRERAWRAWTGRGERPGDTDNRALVHEILTLRAEQARLHGRACYADYALEDTMARDQAAVGRLLSDVWERAKITVERERAQLDALRRADGVAGAIEPWDWRYWAEKVRQRSYAIDDAPSGCSASASSNGPTCPSTTPT